MIPPPIDDPPRWSPAESQGSVWDGDRREQTADHLNLCVAWGLCGQAIAFAVMCAGAEADLTALFGCVIFLSSVISAGLAFGIVLRNWSGLRVTQVLAGSIPWFLVCTESTFFLWLLWLALM